MLICDDNGSNTNIFFGGGGGSLDNRCSKTYTPPQDQGDLTHICKENICRCTQGKTHRDDQRNMNGDSNHDPSVDSLPQATAASPKGTARASVPRRGRSLPASLCTTVLFEPPKDSPAPVTIPKKAPSLLSPNLTLAQNWAKSGPRAACHDAPLP